MNAYEMADWIQNNDCKVVNLDPISVMLKNQADTIAMLEAKLNFFSPKDDEGDFKELTRMEMIDYIEYLRNLLDEITLNNKKTL